MERKCRGCENILPTKMVIDGKIRNINRRKFCLTCSPFGSHNTKKDVNSLTKKKNKHKFICKSCNKEKFEKGSNLECSVCRTRKIRINKRQKAIEYAGGKCVKCDYDKCKDALDFHHLNKDEKMFTISGYWQWDWEKLKPEIDKCILLCCRCHRELHAGVITL